MSGHVIEAPPKSRAEIRRLAELTRTLAEKLLKVTAPYFPIDYVLEPLLLSLDPDFCLEILEEQEMGDNHGLTIPSQHVIKLRQDVYNGACDGKGRDRLTMAHELGHYVLHDDLTFPRKTNPSEIPAYRNSEWQANCFAGELLVSARYAKNCSSAIEVTDRFGVSYECGSYQFNALKKEGLIR
jgi:hypothetical protein